MKVLYLIEHDNGKAGNIGYSDGFTESEKDDFVKNAEETGVMIFSIIKYTE